MKPSSIATLKPGVLRYSLSYVTVNKTTRHQNPEIHREPPLLAFCKVRIISLAVALKLTVHTFFSFDKPQSLTPVQSKEKNYASMIFLWL
jgi:hypothetical protein